MILDFSQASKEGIFIKTLLSTQHLAFCSLMDLQLTNGGLCKTGLLSKFFPKVFGRF